MPIPENLEGFIEEFKNKIADGKTDAIEDLVPILSEAKSYAEEIARIRKNRDELLGEKKQFQQKYSSLVEQLKAKSINPDDIENFQPITAEATKKQIDEMIGNERLMFERRYKELETRASELEKEASGAKNKLTQYEIKQVFLKQAIDAGVDPLFADDLLTILQSRGHNISLDTEKGSVVGYRDPSDPVPFSLEMLLTTHLKTKYPQYYKSQFTGGAGGIKGGGLNGGNNPWASSSFNLTEQAKIAKENPALAEQLRKAARG